MIVFFRLVNRRPLGGCRPCPGRPMGRPVRLHLTRRRRPVGRSRRTLPAPCSPPHQRPGRARASIRFHCQRPADKRPVGRGDHLSRTRTQTRRHGGRRRGGRAQLRDETKLKMGAHRALMIHSRPRLAKMPSAARGPRDLNHFSSRASAGSLARSLCLALSRSVSLSNGRAAHFTATAISHHDVR